MKLLYVKLLLFIPGVFASFASVAYRVAVSNFVGVSVGAVSKLLFYVFNVKLERTTRLFAVEVNINRPFPNYLWPLFQGESWC